MRIEELYRVLCGLHGIDPIDDMERFVVSEVRSDDAIYIGNRLPSREALIMKRSGDELELGLFIAPWILKKLDCEDPLSDPDAFACAVEGVSHFAYVVDRLGRGMAMTKLELELQAEVDKFLLLNIAAAKLHDTSPPEYFAMQFEKCAFDPELCDDDRATYSEASRYAAKYCHYLLKRYFNPLRLSDMLPEARSFFRKGLAEKIARLTP